MYKFREIEECPKCLKEFRPGFALEEPFTEFCAGCLLGTGGHLHRKCPDCGWGYTERCADAD